MNEWEENISFCSFCSSCVQRDYYYRGRLHTERRKTAREKRKNVCFSHHRRPTTEREEVWEIKMKRFLNFNYAEIFFISFCSFWSFGVYGPSSSMVDDYTAERRKTEREREREREKFLYVFPITSRAALQHREKKKFCMWKKNF